MKKNRKGLLPIGYVQVVKMQSEWPYVNSLSLFGCLQVIVSIKSHSQVRFHASTPHHFQKNDFLKFHFSEAASLDFAASAINSSAASTASAASTSLVIQVEAPVCFSYGGCGFDGGNGSLSGGSEWRRCGAQTGQTAQVGADAAEAADTRHSADALSVTCWQEK